MKAKKRTYKRTNIIGAHVMQTRQEQGHTRSALVKKLRRLGIKSNVLLQVLLEKQKRRVFDVEFRAVANALNVTMESLLDMELYEKRMGRYEHRPLRAALRIVENRCDDNADSISR